MNFKDRIQPTTRRSRALSLALSLSCLTLAGVSGGVLLTGCGGSSSSNSTTSAATRAGRATVSIKWPTTTTRLIPVASNSIVISFLQGTTVVATQTVARPTTGSSTTTTFSSLPVGTLTLTAIAKPNTDGTGTAQASASQSVAIVANTDTPVTLTMASTIASITLSPTAPSVTIGGTTALTATPVDSSGSTVLTSSTLTYTSSNTSVATISSSGNVAGVAAGTATITVTETESGKTATATVTVTAASSGTSVVDLANVYINSLSSAQQSATVVANTAANAAKWSNLPGPPASDGTTTLRSGVDYGSLTTAQKTAWVNLVQAVLSANGSNGSNQLTQVRTADYYLGTLQSGYSGDYEYVAFVGTPSSSGNWMLQIGGHHNAHSYYYTGTTLNTTTPYHIAVEPTSFTYNGTAYTPLTTQSTAMTSLLSSFTTAQLTSAKLSSSFSDIYLGPGKDARSNFPTSSRGILASNLTTSQKTLLKTAIAAWVQNSSLSSTYQALYESELDSTYVAYSGNASAPTTVFTTQGDYIRIDGPHVWIEFVCQNGVVIQNKIHYHTIWRDRVTDYNAAYGF